MQLAYQIVVDLRECCCSGLHHLFRSLRSLRVRWWCLVLLLVLLFLVDGRRGGHQRQLLRLRRRQLLQNRKIRAEFDRSQLLRHRRRGHQRREEEGQILLPAKTLCNGKMSFNNFFVSCGASSQKNRFQNNESVCKTIFSMWSGTWMETGDECCRIIAVRKELIETGGLVEVDGNNVW